MRKKTGNKLHTWEAALLLAVAAALLWGACTLQRQDALEQKVIRLHVIANSDSEADQALKLRVRDRVLVLAEDILRRVSGSAGGHRGGSREKLVVRGVPTPVYHCRLRLSGDGRLRRLGGGGSVPHHRGGRRLRPAVPGGGALGGPAPVAGKALSGEGGRSEGLVRRFHMEC